MRKRRVFSLRTFPRPRIENKAARPADASPALIVRIAKWCDAWLPRLAYLAQIIAVAVAVFVYKFTVVPIFQKDKLEEDVARLEIERKTLVEQTEQARVEFASAKSSLDKLKADRDKALAENKDLEIDLTENAMALHNASAKLSATQKELAPVRQALFNEKADWLLATVAMLPSNDTNPFDGKTTITAETLERSWPPQPFDKIKTALDELVSGKTSLNAPIPKVEVVDMARVLRAKILPRQNDLTCPVPNFQVWASAYNNYLAKIAENVDECVEKDEAKQALENGWSKQYVEQLKETDFWPKQHAIYVSACKFNPAIKLQFAFMKEWSALQIACIERGSIASEIAEGRQPTQIATKNIAPPKVDLWAK